MVARLETPMLDLRLDHHPAVRLTVPARERLAQAGALIYVAPTPDGPRYRIVPALVPDDGSLVLVCLDTGELAIRGTNEPAWPGELDDDGAA